MTTEIIEERSVSQRIADMGICRGNLGFWISWILYIVLILISLNVDSLELLIQFLVGTVGAFITGGIRIYFTEKRTKFTWFVWWMTWMAFVAVLFFRLGRS